LNRRSKLKYYLVDKYDNINTTVDLGSNVGLSGARTYFLGTKQIDETEFDKLWRVMTKQQYDNNFKNNLQNRQMGKRKYEWWKDDQSYLDIDK
tara:strand:- start:204 stop:482 length:279 start_codon:yes stop_codon:yes gene_type:complete